MITNKFQLRQICLPVIRASEVLHIKYFADISLSRFNLQAQDHLLGVVVKTPSSNNKQYIVLVLTPELPSMMTTPSDSSNIKEKKGADFQVLIPKSKRALEDDYFSSVISRKGSGVVNIKLPHRGKAAGVYYEVRGIDIKEFLLICKCKLKIDQIRLLEDVSTGAYSKTVQELLGLKSDGNKYPPALDPVRGLLLNFISCVYSR
jgi:antiviral helicase SKI2